MTTSLPKKDFVPAKLYVLFRNWKMKRKNIRKLRQWVKDGKPAPPHVVKQLNVQEYAKRFQLRSFVETGTYEGEMVEAVKGFFDTIISIELEANLYEAARRRFAGDRHITLIQGDSGQELQGGLAQLNEPALFWLDGNYSGGKTAKGELDTPVMKELASICSHRLAKDHVILIDDARCFNNEGDYPGIETLEHVANTAGFDCLEIKDDIIRIFRSR